MKIMFCSQLVRTQWNGLESVLPTLCIYVSNVSIQPGVTHSVWVLPAAQLDLTGNFLTSNIAQLNSFDACYTNVSDGELSF